jgi:prepilin-type N-terminal cleavage/methylation domain-containing protein
MLGSPLVMHSIRSASPPQRIAAFTLVEIMVVVVIIGLLATIAIPAFMRVRQAAQNNRFVSDLRTFAQAFETYALQNGGWAPNAGSGVVPAGMTGDIGAAWTARNSVGGRWNWDRNMNVAAGISTTNITASVAQMRAIDERIDDGDLTSGQFQQFDQRFTYILER